MSQDAFSFVARAVDTTLSRWGLSGMVSGQIIADLVAEGIAFWEQGLLDGSRLALIRFFLPVVRREEVFLGNVLLNDYLSKALIRAIDEGSSGRITLLANDLENYYYLYYGKVSLGEIAEHFRREVVTSLFRLYFGDEDPAQGIYGDVGRMLTFYKSNIEPFPAFAVPRCFLPGMLDKIGGRLHQLVRQEDININVILSILSFFYARDGAEMQSFYRFLDRAMTEGLLAAVKIRAAFAIDQEANFNKDAFTERKKGGVIDKAQLQEAIEEFLNNVQQKIEKGQGEKMAANLAGKMPALSAVQFSTKLLQGTQLGFLPTWVREAENKEEKLPCRFCGADAAVIVEKNITGGFGAGRFYNQSPKLRPFEEALCGRCGISSYLITKLLGMQIARPQPKAKDFPVSKQYNIVFHYGRHDKADAERLAATIDDIFDLIISFRQRAQEEKRFFSLEYIREEIARRAEERHAQQHLEENGVPDPEEALATLIADDAVAPGLETLGQMRRDIQTQLLPLGVGEYRLIAFILPQLQPGRDEALDFVQRRFSRSRLAAFTLLALLRKLCGCSGPYYFQSVPTLAPGGFDVNTFYVRGKAENADEVLRRYSAIVNFARRVAKYQEGHSLLADWILLAEELAEDPLGKFSDVLRDSPLRVGDDLREARYRRLSGEFIKGTGVIDGTEYLRILERLKQL